jgi:tellurite resistance protein TehA-like permease
MATGIVSIAAELEGMHGIARGLHWVNIVSYALLVVFSLARVVLYPREVSSDFRSHQRGPGFFTWVAGTNVVGAQALVLGHDFGAAEFLSFSGAGLWLIMTYGFFAVITTRAHKLAFDDALSGGWLVAVVATQSVSLLASLLVPEEESARTAFVFVALCMFLVGAALYWVLITIIFYRFLFVDLRPDQLDPSYWINMGAAAITALAGSLLFGLRAESALIQTIAPFLLGSSLTFWALATWWIPLLVLLGCWRHIKRRVSFRYVPGYWAIVFPLGMYTVATSRLAQSADIELLSVIPKYFVYVAMGAWSLSCGAMLMSALRRSNDCPGELRADIGVG